MFLKALELRDAENVLKERALQLVWSSDLIIVVDEDMGSSASSTGKCLGFEQIGSMAALVSPAAQPVPVANAPPIDIFPACDEHPGPGADDYIRDPEYPAEAYF